MTNDKFRKALDNYAAERDMEIKVLDNHAYDDSIIGVTEDGRLVYSYDRMVMEYAEDEKCSEEEAIEWIDYNTIRALPYFGEDAPIILDCSTEDIIERYGELEGKE